MGIWKTVKNIFVTSLRHHMILYMNHRDRRIFNGRHIKVHKSPVVFCGLFKDHYMSHTSHFYVDAFIFSVTGLCMWLTIKLNITITRHSIVSTAFFPCPSYFQ